MKLLKFVVIMILYAGIILLAGGGVFCYAAIPGTEIKQLIICEAPLVLLPFITRMLNHARYQMKSNELGMTTDFEYENLSKAEQREFDKIRQLEMERLLPQSALKKMTHKGPANPQLEIDRLVGLAPVKQQLKEILARAEYDRKIDRKGKFKNHFVFFGAPGTGKTTVARIMTSFLYKAGCIRENKCIECDGNILRGSAPGEGGQKAEILVHRAKGGILFIDEAYAMMDNQGSEAINTLIKLMEDLRGEFVLILAGYTDEIKMLLNQNPGFQSRINNYIKFPDYTTDEAVNIFKNMAKDKHLEVSDNVISKFREKYENAKQDRNFGNARTIRNILERAITIHALNLSEGNIENESSGILTAADME